MFYFFIFHINAINVGVHRDIRFYILGVNRRNLGSNRVAILPVLATTLFN